jgi:hypothetical protein
MVVLFNGIGPGLDDDTAMTSQMPKTGIITTNPGPTPVTGEMAILQQ